MRNWHPVDYIIAALALVICVTMSGTIIEVMLDDDAMSELSERRAEIVSSFLASIINIMAMYVGAKIQGNVNKRNNDS